ncbi:RNA polymerase factor sigma-54 [Aquibacillus saliphilus]|uniref:RNA polymerase factor sigma-54 n=1 Tax=Aquibacillus saliphilus TaxID=1909422 RepID=UPI001CF00BD8|nr:RNA polymerase factor sigma-54 [Aquibacillus saliphilus]
MKQTLTQSQNLSWKMTQSLSQSIKLLQYNGLELLDYIKEIANENPLIEPIDTVFDYTIKSCSFSHVSDGGIGSFKDRPPSLYDQMKLQLGEVKVSPELEPVLSYGIGSLDENGYLTIGLSEWAEACSTSEKVVGRALNVIQSLDPSGVGARGLRECLQLQLKRNNPSNEIPQTIVLEHLDWVADEALDLICEEYHLSSEEAMESIIAIRSCHPKPGQLLSNQNASYIVPDAQFYKVDGSWKIRIHKWNYPTIQVSKEYASIKTDDKKTSAYIQEKQQEVQWLQSTINYRKLKLESVLDLLLVEQRDFFEYGPLMLKPLKLRDLATKLDVHLSTVSRMFKNKYVQTPHGTVPFKLFLQSGISNSTGKESSIVYIKQLIKEIIDIEDKQKPISDEAVRKQLLNQYQIEIARRTVAKYRVELKIPTSKLRKRLFC